MDIFEEYLEERWQKLQRQQRKERNMNPELQFALENDLSEALGILDPLLKIGAKTPITKTTLRRVRKLIWQVEAMLVDEGFIHTEEGEDA
jgi:hypothetical protein